MYEFVKFVFKVKANKELWDNKAKEMLGELTRNSQGDSTLNEHNLLNTMDKELDQRKQKSKDLLTIKQQQNDNTKDKADSQNYEYDMKDKKSPT